MERALKVGQCQPHIFHLWVHVSQTFMALIPQLLTAHGSTKHGQKGEDEAAMLQQIRTVNAEAGVWFLEHLVLQKQRMVGPLLILHS